MVAVWGLLLVLGGLGGLAFGYFTGPGSGPVLPSADQEAVLAEYGEPPAFVVADGPLGPNEASARMEQWLYDAAGIRIVFVDGRNVSEDWFTPESAFAAHACSPTDFDRSMRIGDVESLLGEEGTPVPGIETTFDDYEAFDYLESRVLVGYLDGWLYTAQTY
jgi:hypothetical protein